MIDTQMHQHNIFSWIYFSDQNISLQIIFLLLNVSMEKLFIIAENYVLLQYSNRPQFSY